MKGMRILGSLVAWMMVVAMATGCESNYREMLKKQVAAANRGCPIPFGEAATLSSMKYDEEANAVQFFFSINDYTFDVFRQSSDVLKEQILISLKTEESKQILDLMDKANSGLELIFKQKSGNEEIRLMVTADELRGVLKGTKGTAVDNKKQLENIIQMENSVCPYEIDAGMTMSKVYLDGDKAIYECMVDEDAYDMGILQQGNEEVKESIAEEFATEQTMKNAAAIFAENNVEVIYRYVGDTSGERCEIVFTTADLRRVAAK